jgi:hypothetical protein
MSPGRNTSNGFSSQALKESTKDDEKDDKDVDKEKKETTFF